jgi:hypothetical protein
MGAKRPISTLKIMQVATITRDKRRHKTSLIHLRGRNLLNPGSGVILRIRSRLAVGYEL